MYIVYKENEIKQLQLKYLLLEMDTIKISNKEIITAYCVIPTESVSAEEMSKIDFIENSHKGLMEHYKLQEWALCEDAIEFLRGHFKGEVDSFYDILLERIMELKETEYNKDWSSIIIKDNINTTNDKDL